VSTLEGAQQVSPSSPWEKGEERRGDIARTHNFLEIFVFWDGKPIAKEKSI
jgi:hypothetical protein